MVSADSLLINLNEVFDTKTKTNIKLSLAQLSTTIESFKSTSESLNGLVSDNTSAIGETITNFNKISENLTTLSSSLAASDLETIMANLKSTLSSFDTLLSSIENGEGSVGKLMKDESVYNNLEGATKQLELDVPLVMNNCFFHFYRKLEIDLYSKKNPVPPEHLV